MNIGCCGLECEKCNAFIATKNNDDNLREQTAKLWSEQHNVSLKAEDINCTGCREEGAKIGHCNVCQIRQCCIDKNVPNCGKCDQFACDKLDGFFKMFPDGGQDNNKRLKHQKKMKQKKIYIFNSLNLVFLLFID